MRISVTGLPRTPHRKVASRLATRFSLDFFSANEVLIRSKLNKAVVSEHTDVSTDNFIDSALQCWVQSHADFVIDCMHRFPDTITICLYSDLVSVTDFPFDVYTETLRKLTYMPNLCDPNAFDIFINVSGLTVDEIVNNIVYILEEHNYGHFIPLYVCVPADWTDESTEFSVRDGFSIATYFGQYVLLYDNDRALAESAAGRLIKINPNSPCFSPHVLMYRPERIREWLLSLGKVNEVNINRYLLALFAAKSSTVNIDYLYCRIFRNGNVTELLYKLLDKNLNERIE